MKTSELRLNNWIKSPSGLELQIKDGLALDFLKGYKPIPLTEEWLLRFGFESREHTWSDNSISDNLMILNSITVLITDDFISVGQISSENNYQHLANIKYVHRLQNLYFELKDEELTLKE